MTPHRRRINHIVDDPSLSPGDPIKMVDAMISSVEVEPAPLRLDLGGDSYFHITKSLTARLAQLEAQRELAHSTDFVDKGKYPRWFESDEA
jgi:hypothetical protein